MWTSDHRSGLRSACLALLFAACGPGEEPSTPPAVKGQTTPEAGAPLSFPLVEDDLRHDTLLIQVTFDLGDGTHLMVASNVDETFEGVRLYHYRARPDSSAEVLHVSAPGYDSWTMLPTIFGEGTGLGGKWVLANFGERESWGQKLMWYDDGFHGRGFMDVAVPERITDGDTIRLKRGNIAPHMRMHVLGDTIAFTFTCDSVYVYDDHRGGLDRTLPGSRLRYTWHPSMGLEFWIDGDRRAVKDPV